MRTVLALAALELVGAWKPPAPAPGRLAAGGCAWVGPLPQICVPSGVRRSAVVGLEAMTGEGTGRDGAHDARRSLLRGGVGAALGIWGPAAVAAAPGPALLNSKWATEINGRTLDKSIECQVRVKRQHGILLAKHGNKSA